MWRFPELWDIKVFLEVLKLSFLVLTFDHDSSACLGLCNAVVNMFMFESCHLSLPFLEIKQMALQKTKVVY